MNFFKSDSNIKKFLQYTVADYQKNLFSIYYLNNNSNSIEKTPPSSNIIIHNINNTPNDWLFNNPLNPQASDTNDFIQIQSIRKLSKKTDPSIQISIQFILRHVITRLVTRIKFNIKKYIS